MTAGDLIREELSLGTPQLALAKRLAGSIKDDDPEVKRWRFVVRRAADGGEPAKANVTRIAETFGCQPSDLAGRPQQPPGFGRRLGSIETLLASVLENQKQALSTQTSMLAELEERNDELQRLRVAVESLEIAARTAPRQSRRRKAQ